MKLLIALLAGALTVLAYAPFDIFPLVVVCWGVLFYLLGQASSCRRGALLGFAWGLGAFVAGLCWLYIALNRYGNMAPPLAAIAIVLFCAYLAIYPALCGAAFVSIRRANQPWQNACFAAACWTLGEWLRGTVFTGFPWLAVGYTQTPPSPLSGWAPVLGVYGMSFLLTLVSACLMNACLNSRARKTSLATAALVLGAGFALSFVQWTSPVGAPTRFALLQTNIEQGMKWDPKMLGRLLELNAKMVQSHPAQVVVMPETSLPLFVQQLPEEYLESLAESVREQKGDVILGAFMSEGQDRVFNAAVSVGTSPSQHYYKNHLVPFGEFAPPLFGWFFKLAKIPMADQSRGGARQPLLMLGGQKIAMNICYEDLFGEEIIGALPEATVMLNMSNLAWYGESHAQPQHLQIARIRALETGRPMLRSTNTGMTAVIEPNGFVRAVLPTFTADAIVADVRGYAGSTPYSRWGNLPVLLLCLGCVIWGALRRRSDRAKER